LSVPENLGQRLAGSVVTRDIMAAGTYAGNPARLLKLAK
jgi:acetyltransferase-like isoleucine patch superfamily enzyme